MTRPPASSAAPTRPTAAEEDDWLATALRATAREPGPDDAGFTLAVLHRLPPAQACRRPVSAPHAYSLWRTAVLCAGLGAAAALTAPLLADAAASASVATGEGLLDGLPGLSSDPALWCAWLVLLGLLAGWSMVLSDEVPGFGLGATSGD